MLRSVLAIAAGYITMVLLIVLLFLFLGIVFPAAFPQPGVFPSMGWVMFILLFGFVAAVVGAIVTIAITRGPRLKHIHLLALVVLFFGLVTLATNIDTQPLWYLAAQIVVGIAGVYVGGHLADRRFPLTKAT